MTLTFNENLVLTFQAHFTPIFCNAVRHSEINFKISSNLFVIVKINNVKAQRLFESDLTLFVRYPKLTLDGANEFDLTSNSRNALCALSPGYLVSFGVSLSADC